MQLSMEKVPFVVCTHYKVHWKGFLKIHKGCNTFQLLCFRVLFGMMRMELLSTQESDCRSTERKMV